MTTATPATTLQLAAFRARTFAEIARRRAAANPARDALLMLADLLDVAALSFETEPPQIMDGITVTNTIPADAWLALADAETVAEENPGTGFPAHFGRYVTAPVFGRTPDVPGPLNPVSPALATQEINLATALGLVHGHLETTGDREVTAAMLEAALILHGKFARLAASVVIDNARQCNQPTAAPQTPAPAAELDVTGLTAFTVGIIRLAESKGLAPSWTKPHGNTRRLIVNGTGPHGTFGTITIGKTSGKVLRAELIHGNGGSAVKAQGTNAVRALLTSLSVTYCQRDCTAATDAACRP
ncbi:hypothetical protein [Streptomyces sp. NPDC000880]